MSNSLQPHGPQHARLLSVTVSQSLRKFMSIELVMLSNHLIKLLYCKGKNVYFLCFFLIYYLCEKYYNMLQYSTI